MDEQAIRKWAWGEVTNYRVVDEKTELRSHADRIARADELAAWVMSGTVPAE